MRDDSISLANWMSAPMNRRAFRAVRQVVPVAIIDNDPSGVHALPDRLDQRVMDFTDQHGKTWSLSTFFEATDADGFLILKDGGIVFEWYTPGQSQHDEHIVFSVTKSLVGALAGIFVSQGRLDPAAPIANYTPEIEGSGFDQANVRHLLDMTVSLDFEEAYLESCGAFARYREATGWRPVKEGALAGGLHAFLHQIAAGGEPHGRTFHYLSPVTDLLGWVCERAGQASLPSLISELIWAPLKAQAPASITLDGHGAPRAAGGLSCTLRDMARFGECMRNGGSVSATQIVPSAWVEDIVTQGDRNAWERGSLASWIPGGCYRSQWWIMNDDLGAYFAAGIYGNWIYIAPRAGVVIVKQASPPIGPADEGMFKLHLAAFASLARKFA